MDWIKESSRAVKLGGGRLRVKNRRLSIRNVNLLYVVTFVILLVGSVLLSGLSLGWRIIINEVAFLGLPLVAYLLVIGRNPRDTLRLRGVSWQVAGLSLLVGLGLWRFDSWLAAIVNSALDYTIPLPPEALNVTVWDNVAMALGTIVLAPIVEESLFRGAIQGAYERLGPVRAIGGSALLFVMIHQELAQSFALVPVALALGYVTWRTGSIVPAVIVHLGNNAQAVVISLFDGGSPRPMAFTPSAIGALVGGAVAVAALWLVTELTRGPERVREEPKRSWLGRNWPILPIVPIYVAVLGIGLLFSVRPEALALGQRVELGSAPWDEKLRWTYEIRNALDEPVGEAECCLTPNPGSFLLDCAMEQSAYEADAPSGFFSEGSVTQRQIVRWDRRTLGIVEAEIEASISQGREQVELTAMVEDDRMTVRVDGDADAVERFDACDILPATPETGDTPATDEPCRVENALLAGGGIFSPLMIGEWPWRLSAVPFELAYSREATLAWPYRSAEGIEGRTPAKQVGFVVVRTAEEVSTPAGEFVTWRVSVGDKYTAWYTVEAPHTLVAYNDDMVTWQLTEEG